MKQKLQILRGMKDILPDEVFKWQYVEALSRAVFLAYGYKEIRTPVLEDKFLFERSIGDTTDIVQKEMYTLKDKGERIMALRPEGTASIARSYIENNMNQKTGFAKLFYMGAMFRGERPQAGRQRQFHQIGVEAIGSNSPYVDVEVISLLVRLLEKFKLRNFKLKINNLGCFDDRAKIRKELKEILKVKTSRLCGACRERLERNPLRILDCKEDSCGQVTRELPDIFSKNVCGACKSHFEAVIDGLKTLKIAFELDPKMVRGLDYYTRTGFEVSHQSLGAKDAIGAGGRYDSLIKEFGGPDAGACGFAIGVERLILAMDSLGEASWKKEENKPVFIAALGEASWKKGIEILDALRKSDIAADMDYEGKSLKSQMRAADKNKANFVIIIGDEELKAKKAILRNMVTKEQKLISIGNIVEELKGLSNA